MLFAVRFHQDTGDKNLEIWEILEGSGNPSHNHNTIGIMKTYNGQLTTMSCEKVILLADIEKYIRD